VSGLTKKDLALKVAEKTEMRNKDVKNVLDTALKIMMEALVNGEKIELRNFGVFRVKTRGPRMGRNPRTGEKVSIPERRVIQFVPGRLLKERIR
jgi:nucleoid DNA-binding protein